MIKQKAQAPNIKGSCGSRINTDGVIAGSGALKDQNVSGYRATITGGWGAGVSLDVANNNNGTGSTDINGENIYADNGELRPANLTQKLWKRIA